MGLGKVDRDGLALEGGDTTVVVCRGLGAGGLRCLVTSGDSKSAQVLRRAGRVTGHF